jgi:hypothetical protein
MAVTEVPGNAVYQVNLSLCDSNCCKKAADISGLFYGFVGPNLFGQSWAIDYPIKRRAQVNSTVLLTAGKQFNQTCKSTR